MEIIVFLLTVVLRNLQILPKVEVVNLDSLSFFHSSLLDCSVVQRSNSKISVSFSFKFSKNSIFLFSNSSLVIVKG